MGRTNPTFRTILDRYVGQCTRFRRALRHEDKPHFDRVLAKARRHADAAGYMNGRDPETAILLSILLEQEKAIHELRESIEAVESPDQDGVPDENGIHD